MPKCPTTSIFFTVSLGFFFSLFFSSLNLTFSLSLNTVTLSGLGALSAKTSRLETLLNYAYRTVLCKHRGSSKSDARREIGLPTLASRKNFTLLLPCSTVCLPSPLLIFLSFFLWLYPTTTPALLRLPSSTFHLIGLPLAKSHSVAWAQHYGIPVTEHSGH